MSLSAKFDVSLSNGIVSIFQAEDGRYSWAEAKQRACKEIDGVWDARPRARTAAKRIIRGLTLKDLRNGKTYVEVD